MVTMLKRIDCDSLAMPAYQYLAIGEIPQLPVLMDLSIRPTLV